MKQCTKKSLIAVLAIIFSMGSVSSTKTIPRDMSIGATALVGTVLAIHDDELVGCKAIKWLAEKTDTDSRDLVNSSMLATILWGSSYFIENKAIKNVLRAATIATPIIGMITPKKMWEKISKLPLVKDYFSFCSSLRDLPLIGTYFSCPNKECKNICNHCKLTRLYQSLIPLLLFGKGKPPLRQNTATATAGQSYPPNNSSGYAAFVYEQNAAFAHAQHDDSDNDNNSATSNVASHATHTNTASPGHSNQLGHNINLDDIESYDANRHCPVCHINAFEVSLPCHPSHRLCQGCVNQLHARNLPCPLCRAPL